MQTHGFIGRTTLQAQGRFLIYSRSNAAELGLLATLQVYADGSKVADLELGDAIELDREAQSWELIPVESGNVVGQVIVGNGRLHSSRVSGAVDVVDGSVGRAMQGRSFWQGTTRQAAAGLYSVNFCFALSGKVAVRRMGYRIATAGQLVRLWVFQGPGGGIGPDSSLGGKFPENKLVGAPASTGCRLYSDDSSTYGGSAPVMSATNLFGWNEVMLFQADNARTNVELSVPIVLPEGYGVAMVLQSAAATLTTEWDVEELR